MARLLVQKGYFPDVRDVFDSCLGTGCPAYYEKQRYSPAECLKLIRQAGGISFLAHPYLIAKSHGALSPIVDSLKQEGLDGMECSYSSHPPAYEDMYKELCRTRSLLASAGSVSMESTSLTFFWDEFMETKEFLIRFWKKSKIFIGIACDFSHFVL